MKKILVIIGLSFVISCSNKSPDLNEKPLSDASFGVKAYSTHTLVEEKFLEFVDLQLLLQSNPEFKETISKRLNSFKNDVETGMKIKENAKIKNITISDFKESKKERNSILKVTFDIVHEDTIIKDSVLAYISKKTIMIDAEELQTTKVKFSNFNP